MSPNRRPQRNNDGRGPPRGRRSRNDDRRVTMSRRPCRRSRSRSRSRSSRRSQTPPRRSQGATIKWSSDKCLDGSNYSAWKVRVQSQLEARGLWAIVTGEEQPPHKDSRHWHDFWQRETEARAFLLDTLSDTLVTSVGGKMYTYQIFQYLESTYEAKNWGNLVALREEFVTLKYHDGHDMTEHLNNLKTLADKLERQSKAVDEKERVCQLLSSLPNSWSQFKSVYFTQDHPLAWSSMEGAVMAEASRRKQTRRNQTTEFNAALAVARDDDLVSQAEAFVASRRGQHQGTTLNRQPQRTQPSSQQQQSVPQKCYYCQKDGHLKPNCRLRIRHLQERGIPPDSQQDGHAAAAEPDQTASITEALPAAIREIWGLAASTGTDSTRPVNGVIEWVVDSGCTQHMCSQRSIFQSVDTNCATIVRVATNAIAKVEGVGSIILNVQLDNGKPGVIRLGNVLYVPQLRMNLLSVVQAAKEGTSFDFHTKPGSVIMQSKNFTITYPPNQSQLCILRTTWSTPAALSVFTEVIDDLVTPASQYSCRCRRTKLFKD